MTRIPLAISFWFMIATYVIHILDESLLGGSFVEKIRQHWWPEYSWRKFFWFNAGYLFMMCTSVVLYDRIDCYSCPSPGLWNASSTDCGMFGGWFTSASILPGF
jgi:hypothetical protein